MLFYAVQIRSGFAASNYYSRVLLNPRYPVITHKKHVVVDSGAFQDRKKAPISVEEAFKQQMRFVDDLIEAGNVIDAVVMYDVIGNPQATLHNARFYARNRNEIPVMRVSQGETIEQHVDCTLRLADYVEKNDVIAIGGTRAKEKNNSEYRKFTAVLNFLTSQFTRVHLLGVGAPAFLKYARMKEIQTRAIISFDTSSHEMCAAMRWRTVCSLSMRRAYDGNTPKQHLVRENFFAFLKFIDLLNKQQAFVHQNALWDENLMIALNIER